MGAKRHGHDASRKMSDADRRMMDAIREMLGFRRLYTARAPDVLWWDSWPSEESREHRNGRTT